jgi:NAD+ synthase
MKTNLLLKDPAKKIEEIVAFIKETYQSQSIKNAVIAVSGGIDSALALTLLTSALPLENIFPILLPYAQQDMFDAESLLKHLNIPTKNISKIDIAPIVDQAVLSFNFSQEKLENSKEKIRFANLQARTRMMAVFDLAKQKDALVCGTENKSEKYLGYFTRFGDEGSDLEPIVNLYKNQVRQLVEFLELPKVFLEKAPSAGLWAGQSDEEELGFSYQLADRVLEQLIDFNKNAEEILEIFSNTSTDLSKVKKILERVKNTSYKQQVPYHI